MRCDTGSNCIEAPNLGDGGFTEVRLLTLVGDGVVPVAVLVVDVGVTPGGEPPVGDDDVDVV